MRNARAPHAGSRGGPAAALPVLVEVLAGLAQVRKGYLNFLEQPPALLDSSGGLSPFLPQWS